ncbi:hypothetical protein A3860_11320 [Niastella vici]|uniref:Alpha/beta hydrolase n=1 Tax=Niastella vici TaxID=1703345 RepID=A0A1V9FG14_9BACT|nr:hypothetical protein [Niastella vici]OQP57146.1 hypothetical protein A3860_11320 [Niastella vici]
MKPLIVSILLCLLYTWATAQHIQHDLPDTIDAAGYYLFYLHGGVVTNKGDNAINDPVPQFGPYQYSRILDTLRAHGFYIISERRFPGVDDSVYARKIVQQIDTLLKANVLARDIILVGASAGTDIVLQVSVLLKNPQMKYVIMGGCWPNEYKTWLTMPLKGRFLSIIESNDPHGTCNKIFETHKEIKDHHEIKLETGLSHGFLYKPYAAWVNPLVQWFQIYAAGYRARTPALIDGH